MVLGDGCPGNFAQLKNFVLKYRIFPKLENSRSMIHVDNLAEFIRRCIEEERCGIYHPQDPVYHSSLELARGVAEAADIEIKECPYLAFGVRVCAPFWGKLNKVWGNLVYARDIDEK